LRFKMNKYLLKTGSVLLSSLLFMSCTDQPSQPEFDYKPEINVIGLLILNNNQKNIRIERTFSIKEKITDDRYISDALVFVHCGEQKVPFVHLFDGNYADENNDLELRAGAYYQLEVLLNDGRQVFAETQMPARPSILDPIKEQMVGAFTTLQVNWQGAPFAYRYAVSIEGLSNSFEIMDFSEDTEQTMFAFLFAGPGTYRLKVSSLDINFYDYSRERSNRYPIQHMDGALGVFGAMAYETVVFQAE